MKHVSALENLRLLWPLAFIKYKTRVKVALVIGSVRNLVVQATCSECPVFRRLLFQGCIILMYQVFCY